MVSYFCAYSLNEENAKGLIPDGFQHFKLPLP